MITDGKSLAETNAELGTALARCRNDLDAAGELISNLQEANHKQGKIRKAKLLSTQTRYQNAMNTLAQTKGQISILTEQLSTQDHECARLAVAIELMQSMTD